MTYITDLDGTLLNNFGRLDLKSKNILHTISDRLVLATARSLVNIDNDILNLYPSIIITMNGASIVKDEVVIRRYTLNIMEVLSDFQILNDLAAQIVIEEDMKYSLLKSKDIKSSFFNEKNRIPVGELTMPLSVIFIIQNKYLSTLTINSDKYNVEKWNFNTDYTAIEVLHIKATKANAIGWLLRYEYINEFKYFGDSINDESVLKLYTKNFYAMRSSDISKNKMVENITDYTNDECGVALEIARIERETYGNSR